MTNERLWDLVRYARGYLFDADLIDQDEYTELLLQETFEAVISKLMEVIERRDATIKLLRETILNQEEVNSRSIELLKAASSLIKDNRLEEYTTFYDEATCDGQCLIDDINIVLSVYRGQVLAENATTQKETE